MAGFRGTSIEQDSRFFNQEKKLLASMAFPKSFDQRVDLAKVQREVISQWVTDRLTQLLGFEDDIVVSMVINLLEPKVDERLDPRQLQVAVTGFLGKDAAGFTEELWELLLSAQANPTGIPTAILDKKKKELERAAADKAKLRQVLDGKRADAEPARRRRDAFGRDIKEEPEDRGRPQARPDREGDRRRQSPERPRFDSQRRSRDREQEPRSERRRPRSPERYGRRERYPTRSRSRSISRSRSRRDHRRSPSRSRNRSCSSPPRRRESRRSVSPRRSRSRRGHRRSRSASSASSVPSRSASPPRRRHRARSPSGHK